MKIKFKKLNERASIPSYANEGDAGMDLVATTITRLSAFFEYGTDLSMEIPKGYVGFIFPRSSISNTDHYLRNSVGVIDSGYRGEVKIRMSIPELGKKEYNPGDKIAQLIIIKLPFVDIEEVEDLKDSDRGAYGFGSSGS
jgi:dUTP pyrophosphatase|tara:strand:- start:93 stop:512 length:420 start_codon:yes stop_codon:yes gene_type:complete